MTDFFQSMFLIDSLDDQCLNERLAHPTEWLGYFAQNMLPKKLFDAHPLIGFATGRFLSEQHHMHAKPLGLDHSLLQNQDAMAIGLPRPYRWLLDPRHSPETAPHTPESLQDLLAYN